MSILDSRRLASTSAAGSCEEPSSKKPRKPRKKKTDTHSEESAHPIGSKVSSYLEEIEATKNDVSSADIESFRPSHAASRNLVNYTKQHKELLNRLTKAFNKQQLRAYLMDGGVMTSTSASKKACALRVIERVWGWPSLVEWERKEHDKRTIVSESFSLSNHELFLFLGTGSNSLSALSQKHNVQLSLNDDVTSLHAQGRPSAIEQFATYIRFFRADVNSETISLPFGKKLSSSDMENIARYSGVYTESAADGGVKIVFRKSDTEGYECARRLAYQIALGKRSVASTVFHVPPIPPPTDTYLDFPVDDQTLQNYSLYPFISTGAIIGSDQNQTGFRLRKISRWFSVFPPTGSSQGSMGGYVTVTTGNTNLNLQGIIRKQIDDLKPTGSVEVNATLGHVLFRRPTNDQTSLIAPLEGPLSTGRIQRWVRNGGVMDFQSSLPGPLWEFNSEHDDDSRRIIYSEQPLDGGTADKSAVHNYMVVEVPISTPAESDVPIARPTCEQVSRVPSNMLIPDQPFDVQLTVTSKKQVEKGPREIEALVKALAESSQGDATKIPLSFEFEGRKYILDSNLHVRKSRKVIGTGAVPGAGWHLAVEHIRDLDRGEDQHSCSIHSADAGTDKGWESLFNKITWLVQYSEAGNSNSMHVARKLLKGLLS